MTNVCNPQQERASPSFHKVPLCPLPANPLSHPRPWPLGIYFLSWQSYVPEYHRSGIAACIVFGAWLFSWSTVLSRSSRVDACMCIWMAFAVGENSVVRIWHSLSIWSLVYMIHLGCFRWEVISNKVAVDICTRVILEADVFISLTWIHGGRILGWGWVCV